jgi:molecular chaperone HscC
MRYAEMTVIGIDLGTTNSIVAYWAEKGPEIIPNVLGEKLTPSVISVDENGDILVGQIAKERLITHPHLTVSNFKRYMGSEKVYKLGNYSFTPEELSSFIIRTLKEDAEAFLGSEVTEAVISVPAYFNDVQRKATKRSAEIAGLKVDRLISEPTAAAISYGLHEQDSETKFLIFDLGGGTFDVSILELFEGVMEVKSIAGDNFLGGEDFTNLLAAHFLDTHGIDIITLDNKSHAAIYKQAEICKRNLGREEVGKMVLTINGETFETRIDRPTFETLVNPLLLRLRNPIDRALRDAALSPENLDAIILIGGTTRMPIIRSVVSKMFGRIPYININPDEAVALGTAIQVALKERNSALNEIILTDVCPYTLGTDIVRLIEDGGYETGYYLPIIERNTPIPVSKVKRLYTVSDNQKVIQVEIYQGESRRTEGNLKLGELNIKVAPAPQGKQSIDVRYTYDINGILEVELVNVETGAKKSIVIEKNQGTLSKEEIEKRLDELKNIKIHPRERAENRLLLAKGERLYEESLGEKRKVIEFLLIEFENTLARQNEWEVTKAAKKLKAELDKLERWHD